MIVIIDYKMGNLASILNILKKIKVEAKISSCVQDILSAEKLILPGVGSFDHAVSNLNELGILPAINEKVLGRDTPIMGICLGMQLFTEGSQEGKLGGLGWVKAKTIRFNFDQSQKYLKVPHMGWNSVSLQKNDSVIFRGIKEQPRFYFVHSYHLVCDEGLSVGKTCYGYEFTSVLQYKNIVGVQFHPEKSHKFGMALLNNFAELF